MKQASEKIFAIARRGMRLLVVAMICILLPATGAFAQEEESKDLDYLCIAGIGCAMYDPSDACPGAPAAIPQNVTLDQHRTENAKAVIGIAKKLNLGQRGALIGLMVALAEGGLRNYANSGIPVSMENPAWLALPQPRPLGSDHSSVGIFQQRPDFGWSTIATGPAALSNRAAVWQNMHPPYAAQAFFGSPPGSNMPPAVSKGLQNKSNWQTGPEWEVAQDVQASAYTGIPSAANHYSNVKGGNYKAKMAEAQGILNQLWESTSPYELPIPLGSGTAGPQPTTQSVSCATQGTVNCDGGSAPSGISETRKKVVCIAEQEYALWQPPGQGVLKPGTGFYKYSQNRPEEWCADFASWVYQQAGYPLIPNNQGNVPAVRTIREIGQKQQNFKFHPVGSYVPRPGDFAIHEANGASHVNLVTAVNGNTITTIGGNQGRYGFTLTSVTKYDVQGFGGDNISGYVSPD